MRRFDNKGMMLIPEPIADDNIREGKVLIITDVYCQKGHNLMNQRATFNGHPGIVLDVEMGDQKAPMALSPIVGDKVRVCLDIDLKDGETVKLLCPHCGIELPKHSDCDVCDGDLIALFITPEGNFNDCVAICNKIGCPKANIVTSGDLIALTHLQIT